MMRFPSLIVLGALALAHVPAFAQAPSDAERCRLDGGNPDVTIQHCTRAIESGQLPRGELAIMHFNRGVELIGKSDYDRAIADFDAALKHDSRMTEARYNRGIAWANKGDPDRAIADFNAVLQAAPADADALHSRGTEWMVKGEYERALADFAAAAKSAARPGDLHFARGRALFYSGRHAEAVNELARAHRWQPSDYTALWLFLARKHAGAADAEVLIERDTRSTRDGGWPSGLIALYAGQAEPEPAMKSAGDPDAKKQAEQRCEAGFYVAHWHLLKKAGDRAIKLFEEVRRTCPKNIIEYEGALAALRHLGAR